MEPFPCLPSLAQARRHAEGSPCGVLVASQDGCPRGEGCESVVGPGAGVAERCPAASRVRGRRAAGGPLGSSRGYLWGRKEATDEPCGELERAWGRDVSVQTSYTSCVTLDLSEGLVIAPPPAGIRTRSCKCGLVKELRAGIFSVGRCGERRISGAPILRVRSLSLPLALDEEETFLACFGEVLLPLGTRARIIDCGSGLASSPWAALTRGRVGRHAYCEVKPFH